MMSPEEHRWIKQEIVRQLNIILHGSAQDSNGQTETINDMFPGMPGITERPIVHPYGMVSRAPKGTISVNARVGEHVGNRTIIGHRDANRPTVSEEGGVTLYDSGGNVIKFVPSMGITIKALQAVIDSDAIKLGLSADQPLVLGTVLQEVLSGILDTLSTMATAISTHMHPTAAPGAPSPPINAADFVTAGSDLSAFQSSPIDDGAILSEKVTTE